MEGMIELETLLKGGQEIFEKVKEAGREGGRGRGGERMMVVSFEKSEL